MSDTWQQELQNRRIQYLGKSLLNGGASLPFEALQKNVLREVPGAIGIKTVTIKKMAYAVAQGHKVETFTEAEKVKLPLGPQMRRWTNERLAQKKMSGHPGGLPEKEEVSPGEAQRSSNPLLASWWAREIQPRLEAQGIRGVVWQLGDSPEVELVTKVKL